MMVDKKDARMVLMMVLTMNKKKAVTMDKKKAVSMDVMMVLMM